MKYETFDPQLEIIEGNEWVSWTFADGPNDKDGKSGVRIHIIRKWVIVRGSGGGESQSIFSSFAKVMSIKIEWIEEQLTLESISKDNKTGKKLQLMRDYI